MDVVFGTHYDRMDLTEPSAPAVGIPSDAGSSSINVPDIDNEGVISALPRDFRSAPDAPWDASTAPSRLDRFSKRVFDIAFAAFVLAVTTPIVLAAIVAIRLESPGSAIYRQERMGLRGRPFRLVKLRGMYADAEARFPELYNYSQLSADDRDTMFFHRSDDPRVTRVGRLIRRWSIDELPNFWNVLVGDMSVVGPRPEIPALAHLYGDALPRLLWVKPGVTSPAKARGRDLLSFSETLSKELEYIESRSFRLDLQTIGQTALGVLRSSGS